MVRGNEVLVSKVINEVGKINEGGVVKTTFIEKL